MAAFNQSAIAVERARAYLADVRAGHVSFADESAPFLTLTRHLGALLEVIDGASSTRAVRAAARAVLAELPDAGLLRSDREADQSPWFWIARLAASLREVLGSIAAKLMALEEAERDALRQALTDAVGVRIAAAAQPCADCVLHPALLCPRHAGELDWVSSYRMLAEDLGLELAPAGGGAARICRGSIPMSENLEAAAVGDPVGHARHAIIRCLHGPRPEHRARRLVVSILGGAGVVGRLPDVELAVHELVANARLHAPGPYELRILLGRGSMKIAVMDGGGDHAELGRRLLRAVSGEPAGRESGRGLQIVTGLFPGSCGAEPTVTCTGITPAKQVWIEIECPVQNEP